MKEFHSLFREIHTTFKGADRILIVAHQKPDGDALGSTLALAHYLAHLGKTHVCFCIDEVPRQYSYLPRAKEFITNHEDIQNLHFDVICILDSGDLAYAGVEELIERLQEHKPTIINIDHHPTNTHFGHVNVVHDRASSTSEMIFHFLDFCRHPISQDVATCLLTGILTDTGVFSNLATTPSSLEAASRLLSYGARVKQIMQHTMRNKTLANMRLWGRALSRLKQNPETGVVSTAILQKDFDELGIDDDSTEGISNFLNNLGEAKMIMVYKESKDGKIKVSLRTTQPDVDVSTVAQKYGGGGHRKAAGFTLHGKLQETGTGWEVASVGNRPSI